MRFRLRAALLVLAAVFHVGTAGYVLIEGELRHALGRARRTRMIEKLAGYEIVCAGAAWGSGSWRRCSATGGPA